MRHLIINDAPWEHDLTLEVAPETLTLIVHPSPPPANEHFAVAKNPLVRSWRLADLQARHDCDFYCTFARLPYTGSGNVIWGLTDLVNWYAFSSVVKLHPKMFGQIMDAYGPVSILSPRADCKFTDMVFFIKKHRAHKVVTNLSDVGEVEHFNSSFSDPRWPQVFLDAPPTLPAGGSADVRASVTNYPGEFTFHFEATAGYLSKRRVRGVNGYTRLTALGLAPGDTIKLKAGFHYTPGLAEAEILVV